MSARQTVWSSRARTGLTSLDGRLCLLLAACLSSLASLAWPSVTMVASRTNNTVLAQKLFLFHSESQCHFPISPMTSLCPPACNGTGSFRCSPPSGQPSTGALSFQINRSLRLAAPTASSRQLLVLTFDIFICCKKMKFWQPYFNNHNLSGLYG